MMTRGHARRLPDEMQIRYAEPFVSTVEQAIRYSIAQNRARGFFLSLQDVKYRAVQSEGRPDVLCRDSDRLGAGSRCDLATGEAT